MRIPAGLPTTDSITKQARRALRPWWPEISLIAAALLLCTRFPQYLPTTPDDYAFAIVNLKRQYYALIQGEWISQNRLQWLITFPIYIIITKALFFLRWTAGVHVAFLFAPLLAIYYALRCQGLLLEARLGSCILLAIQALGYEHTTPLGYPIFFLAANAISIASGFQLGKSSARTRTARTSLSWPSAAYLIAGSISGLLYEYFPLLFLISGLWGYLGTANKREKSKAARQTSRRWTQLAVQLALFSTPIFIMIGLKGLGWLLAKDTAGFNTYKGNSIDVTSLTIAHFTTSLQISFNTLIGSTILGHTHWLLSWPRVQFTFMPTLTSLVYGGLLAIATFLSLVPAISRLELNQQRPSTRDHAIAFACLLGMTGTQLIFNSMTSRHHEWFPPSGNTFTQTYLNASMAVATASFVTALAVTIAIPANWPRGDASFNHRLIQRVSILLLSGFLGFMACLSMTHNLEIAKIVQDRAASLEDVVTTCRKNRAHQNQDGFTTDPPEMRIPFLIHKNFLDNRTGTYIGTICRDSLTRPELFSRWRSGVPTDQERTNITAWGERVPKAATLLGHFISLPTSIGIESHDDAIAWAWLSEPNASSLTFQRHQSIPKGWVIRLIPSKQYKELSLEVRNGTTERNSLIVVGAKGMDLSQLLMNGGSVTVVAAQPAATMSDKPVSVPLPLSPADPRKSYFRVEVSKVEATTTP